jgi:signal transduction histidine kinase
MEEKIMEVDKSKKPCKFGFWSKVWWFVAETVLAIIIAFCFIGAIAMEEAGFYNTSRYRIINDAYSQIFSEDSMFLIGNVLAEDYSRNDNYCATSNVAYANVVQPLESGNKKVLWEFGNSELADDALFTYEYCYWNDEDGYICKIALTNQLTERDNYRTLYYCIKFCYDLRFAVYVIGAVCLILWILIFVALLSSAGYAKGSTVPKPVFESYIPFEINLAVVAGIGAFVLLVLGNIHGANLLEMLLVFLLLVAAEIYFLFWCVWFAIRVKTGYLWKSSLLRLILIGLGKAFTALGKALAQMFKAMPAIWQMVLGYILTWVIFAISVVCILDDWFSAFGWILFWFMTFAVLAFIVYISVVYNKLRNKTKELANGDLSKELNTKFMFPIFKEHAKNLEKISGGIVLSNEKRLASEKTQSALITNVSHDIKTPLTSIINYADLISKQECENENIKEYAEVLGRQSTRLKRLLEDLIEVSKAQSGALDVKLEPCKAAMLLNQAAGEFEDKLRDQRLELITKNADSDLVIMADPRRMWRVFDNLFSNICKYAQPGTRVYMSLEEDNGKCRIVFKNTSAKELDVSPEELMARFVRGDKSREGAEGNGLGLSIASSLTSLQNGTMDIAIDGDLFKVILEFAVVNNG